MLGYFCFLAAILGVRSASAPFITPCMAGDNACAQASAQAAIPVFARGVPELGVKPLDPMHLELIESDQAGLRLTLRNTMLTGLRNCRVDSLKEEFSSERSRVILVLRCTVELVGDYTLGGQFIVLPVHGKGPYHIKIREIVVKAVIDLSLRTGEGGKEHWRVERWRHGYHTQGGAKFTFHNLFNGNKVLAYPVEQYLNNNWRNVMQEIAPPIVRAIIAGVVDAVAAFYNAVPVDEFYIPA